MRTLLIAMRPSRIESYAQKVLTKGLLNNKIHPLTKVDQ